MRIILIIFVLSSLLITCKSPFVKGKECGTFKNTLREFASKFQPYNENCSTYNFEQDSLKYVDYGFINGKRHFMDFRLNEVLYYQEQLSNRYLDSVNISMNCTHKVNKSDIIGLFGENYSYNEFYKEISYNLCLFLSKREFSYVSFELDNNDNIKSIYINMYGW